jgi:predicted secreted protein
MRDVWIATVMTVVLLALLLCLPLPETGVVQLSERDNGNDVHLKTGQELVIHVNAVDGEAAVWSLSEADRHILQWSAPEFRERPAPHLGSLVDVVWRFRATAAGRSPVRLDLQTLPGVQPTRVNRSFRVQVAVE